MALIRALDTSMRTPSRKATAQAARVRSKGILVTPLSSGRTHMRLAEHMRSPNASSSQTG